MNQLICAVTGANGYVGKHLINSLREKNNIVYELIRSEKSAQQEKFFLPYSLDQGTLPNLRHIDTLIHCAYDFSATTTIQSEKINLNGSVRLLEHAKTCGVKKIIVISSMSAFEGAQSVYGKTKLALEKKAGEFGAIVVRPGLIFGKNTRGIVGVMQKFVKKFPIVPLIGNGEQKFYPCYIDDLCQLIACLIGTDLVIQKPIVAATKNPITFREIIKTLAKSDNKKIFLIPIPFLLILCGLKLLEAMHISMGLRSDSLIGAKFYDKNPDFSELEVFNICFRTMDPGLL